MMGISERVEVRFSVIGTRCVSSGAEGAIGREKRKGGSGGG